MLRSRAPSLLSFKPPSSTVSKRKRPRLGIYCDGEQEGSDDENSSTTSATSSLGVNPQLVLVRAFKIPFKDPDSLSQLTANRQTTLGVRPRTQMIARPLHDPNEEGAIVLYWPPELSAEEKVKLLASKGMSKNVEEQVAVVVDPVLAKVLRPHQIEGVRFLWECVTGRRVEDAFGCIMADEMGLGKTLQCISLLWTLLRQSPNPFQPEIDKCLIVCPSSLVKNWGNEIIKWLGSRVNPLTCGDRAGKDKVIQDLQRFATGRGRANPYPVLIISYETLRSHCTVLKNTSIGLLLCDEGHRLKNSQSQTFVALNELNVQRRVILSGTPVQNDLSEYFSLLNFANPNILGTPMEFRRKYEIPILRGRDVDCTDSERQTSDAQLAELTTLASRFIIRRTNDILTKYLPVKYEHIVFCRLGPLQLELYKLFVKSAAVKQLLLEEEEGVSKSSSDSSTRLQPLKAITLLKKLCNDAKLLELPEQIPGSENFLPLNWGVEATGRQRHQDFWMEGKMTVLDRLLTKIKQEGEKVVLISNYTQTLDLFVKLCHFRKYSFLRLDGTMNINKRSQLVDRFNNPENGEFIFLLSSKAGGCGLNLIGANRLVLFDPDWNPAADQQALARVWRDGQSKTCYIYRLIGTGTIEEKIFQRQTHKLSLSSCVVDALEDVERHFSQENLRMLFRLNEKTSCETHDTFRCKRCVAGRMVKEHPDMTYGDTSTWNHYSEADFAKLSDPILKEGIKGQASFVFQFQTQNKPRVF